MLHKQTSLNTTLPLRNPFIRNPARTNHMSVNCGENKRTHT
nr:MAG TPA: hypothetical protein [Caudoviricetes sp.]